MGGGGGGGCAAFCNFSVYDCAWILEWDMSGA